MKHFNIKEFDCPCCKQNNLELGFQGKIDYAREVSGVPFVINSGFRCKKHNKAVGGKFTSSHMLGVACDINAVDSRRRFRIVEGLLAAGFKRIGIGKDFVHVDDDIEKDQNVIWVY